MDVDVIVMGAGAAGMMCAATAGQRGRRVLLVDHAPRLAEKIRISGGGRCNFTNRDIRPEAFLSRNPHFCRSALSRYSAQDFIELVERHGIAYHERELGQLFCNDSAQQIITMLRAECDAAAVQWLMPAAIVAVEHYSADGQDGYQVTTAQGTYTAQSLVVATGGLSIPKVGATPLGLRIAEQFGLAIVPPKPALVPLAADPEWLARFGVLAGSSFTASTTCAEDRLAPRFREAALITHRGLSGPSILQISSYWQQAGGRGSILIDLLPDCDVEAWLALHRRDAQLFSALLSEHLPRRFATSFAEVHGWTQSMAQLSNTTVATIAQTLKAWRIQPSGSLGYSKAEVTLGGVDTQELAQQTMMARRAPGLYFIGEVVDVTGWLGGYNFQWAWSSGYVAGMAA